MLLLYGDYTDMMEGQTGHLLRSRDEGRSWSDPELVLAPRWWKGGTHTSLGMQTLKSGRVLIPWTQGFNMKEDWTRPTQFICLRSDDNGRTWQGWDPQDAGIESSIPYGKIVELDNGELLCAVWGLIRKEFEIKDQRVNRYHNSGLLRSKDQGVTWGEYTPINHEGYMETDLTLLPDGRVLALLRRSNKPLYMKTELPWTYYSFSEDEGRTWSPSKPTNVFGQNFNAWITSDGTMLGACRGWDGMGKSNAAEICDNDKRHTDQKGFGIHFFVAEDMGARWAYQFTLPDPKGREYTDSSDAGEPTFCDLSNGDLFVAYYSRDDAIFDTVNLEALNPYARMQAERMPKFFKRRVCACIIRKKP